MKGDLSSMFSRGSESMASDGVPLLFVTSAPEDRSQAEFLAGALLGRAIRTWRSPMASRETGLLDEASIQAAESAVAFLLMASKAASRNEDVKHELIVATQLAKPILAVRLDDGAMGELEPFLGRACWIDGSKDVEVVTRDIQANLPGVAPVSLETSTAATEPPRSFPRFLVLLMGMVGVTALGLSLYYSGLFGGLSQNQSAIFNTTARASLSQPAMDDVPITSFSVPPEGCRTMITRRGSYEYQVAMTGPGEDSTSVAGLPDGYRVYSCERRGGSEAVVFPARAEDWALCAPATGDRYPRPSGRCHSGWMSVSSFIPG